MQACRQARMLQKSPCKCWHVADVLTPAIHRHADRHSVVTFSFSPKYELHLSTVSDSFSKLVAGAMLADIVQKADAVQYAHACRFDGTPTYDGTHAQIDWLYAHTNIEHGAQILLLRQMRTYITIDLFYCMCITTNDPISIVKQRQFGCDIIHSGSILMTILIENVSISPEVTEGVCTWNSQPNPNCIHYLAALGTAKQGMSRNSVSHT